MFFPNSLSPELSGLSSCGQREEESELETLEPSWPHKLLSLGGFREREPSLMEILFVFTEGRWGNIDAEAQNPKWATQEQHRNMSFEDV